MTRALLNFGFFTYRSPHHGSKIWQKNLVGAQLESRWRSDPQVPQLFCSRGTIMARTLLNFGCLRHCSPHDGTAHLTTEARRDDKIIKICFRLSKLVLTNSFVDDFL